jgi:peptidoglycan DL-endopeptidase CwlO
LKNGLTLIAALVACSLSACSTKTKVIVKREIVYVDRSKPLAEPQPKNREPIEPGQVKHSPRIGEVITAAREHIGKRRIKVEGRSYRFDCSGFVRGVFSILGIDLMSLSHEYRRANGVRLIFYYIERFGRNHRDNPTVGDVVYFDNTYDKNKNGKLDDLLTHIGLVESLETDGTFYVIHRTSRGIIREPMNLRKANKRRDQKGKIINGWLRRKKRRDPPGTPYLMGELFAGFGTIPTNPPVLSLYGKYLVLTDLVAGPSH